MMKMILILCILVTRIAAVDPVIGAAIIGAGATLLASSGGGGASTTVYQLNTGDLINADQCWQDGGGACPNGNCLDNDGRRGLVISQTDVDCKWYCPHRGHCKTQICCDRYTGPVPKPSTRPLQIPLNTPNNCWKKYPGLLKQVDVGQYGVWGVNSQDDIFRKTPTSWERVQGLLKDISVGKNSVWGVNSDDGIFWKSGGNWQNVGGLLKQVSVCTTSDSTVWGVNAQDDIFSYNRGQNNWEKIDGLLSVVSCGGSGVWGVNDEDEIFHREGTYGGGASNGISWKKVDGLLVWISSGSQGEVWGTNKEGDVYKRTGITQSNPAGSGWKKITPRFLKKVSIWNGQVWGVNQDDGIFYARTSCFP